MVTKLIVNQHLLPRLQPMVTVFDEVLQIGETYEGAH